jgi:hypothetical protein
MGEAPRSARQRSRSFVLSVLGGLAVTLAATGADLGSAVAQETPTQSGPQVTVTPYLWLAGINSAIKTPLPRVPEVNSDVGAFQLLGHLNGVPFMGSAEVRDGPFSLFGDVLHVPVGTNITTRNILFHGGNAALTTNTGTALFLYHAIDQPFQELDAGGGFRAWGFSSRLTLNAGLLPTANVSRTAGWADPLLAARYHRQFNNGFGVTAYGDAGGFGVGAHVDWQVIGTLDYDPKPWLTLRLGYRSLNFNYQGGNNVGFNVHMKGPILAADFRL